MRRCVLVLLCCLLAAAGLAAIPSVAEADTQAALSLTGFADMAPDVADGRLYVSDDSDSVAVLGLDGSVLAEVDGLPGAGDLVLSPDKQTLWVAAPDARQIVAIRTADLTWTAFATGDYTCPTDLAVVDGKVWWLAGCTYNTVGVLDPTDGSVATTHAPSAVWSGSFTAAADPSVPGTLFVGLGYPDEEVLRYAVTPGPTPSLELQAHLAKAQGAGDALQVSADGTTVSTAGVDARAVDLEPVHRYREGWGSLARSDGGMRATGSLMIYEPHNPNPFAFYKLRVPVGGLAWVGEQLVAITGNPDNGYVFRTIEPHAVPTMTAGIHRPSNSYDYGDEVTIAVEMEYAPPGALVTLYAQSPDGVRTELASGSLNRRERVALRFTAERSTDVVAVYAGDDRHDPAEDATSVRSTVGMTSSAHGYSARDGQAYLYGATRRAVVSFKVQPDHAGECLTVYLSYMSYAHSWETLGSIKCLRLSSRSTAKVFVQGRPQLVGVPLLVSPVKPQTRTNTKTYGPVVHIRFRR